MKRTLLTFIMVFSLIALYAQSLVDTLPQNRKVVLEEFTGIHCGYCPDGHKMANEYAEAHPGDVLLINIHVGSYAQPGAGEPDFRTQWGTAIKDQTGLTGYPAGTINRHLFTGWEQGSGTAMSRSHWAEAGDLILAENSYVNIAATAEIDVTTREMTVVVEAYYTGDSPESSNWLNVAILQDNIEGPQSGAASFYPEMLLPNGNYLHQHMLRDLITGQWGEEITTTTTGSFYTNTYTYTLPDDYTNVPVNIGNINLGVFITETHQEVVSGVKVIPTYVNFATTNNARLYSLVLPDKLCNNEVAPTMKIQNLGSADLTELSFEYEVNGGTPATFTWTGLLSSFEELEINLDPISFTMAANNTLTVTSTTTNGVADEDASDNTVSGTFDQAPASYSTVYFTLKTDNYGSETTWEIVDANGTVYASGGPYTDASQVVEDNIEIILPALGCYSFNIYDAYGDGIDGGYGVGYYELTDSEGNPVADGGQFASEEFRPFEVTNMTIGIEENIFENSVNITPNPANTNAYVEFNLENSQVVLIKLFNTQGQLVSETEEYIKSGNNKTAIDISSFEAGLYIISIQANNSTYTQKLIVE